MDYEVAHTVLYMQKVNTAHRECTGRNDRHSIYSLVSLYTSVSGYVQLLRFSYISLQVLPVDILSRCMLYYRYPIIAHTLCSKQKLHRQTEEEMIDG